MHYKSSIWEEKKGKQKRATIREQKLLFYITTEQRSHCSVTTEQSKCALSLHHIYLKLHSQGGEMAMRWAEGSSWLRRRLDLLTGVNFDSTVWPCTFRYKYEQQGFITHPCMSIK
jgi:hypothetical protein